MIALKEKPILFSGPMVRAILEGRKTQTRRIVDPQPKFYAKSPDFPESFIWQHKHANTQNDKSPYFGAWVDSYEVGLGEFIKFLVSFAPYQKGDVLWVRETFRIRGGGIIRSIGYKASPDDIDEEAKWKPSIFMPMSACRLKAEVTSVRVQRLQDISKEDAIAEGIESEHAWDGQPGFGYDMGMWYKDYSKNGVTIQSPVASYGSLWDSINGKRNGGIYAWDKNPWVFAYTFKEHWRAA